MRTVHETEALRPSDPVPKSMQSGPTGKSGKLKIIIKTQQSHAAGQEDSVDDGSNNDDLGLDYTPVTEEQGFAPEELAMPFQRLYKYCYAKVKIVEREGEALLRDCDAWEKVYLHETLEKEALLAQVIESEINWHERRQAVLSGSADVQVTVAASEATQNLLAKKQAASPLVPATGGTLGRGKITIYQDPEDLDDE
jgi:hypothetical protein